MSAITDQDTITRLLKERPEQLNGFKVIAQDGEAGTVTENQGDVDDDHLVVHVGKIFGHDVVIENQVINLIDPEAQEIHVQRIADWVKSSPKLKDLSLS